MLRTFPRVSPPSVLRTFPWVSPMAIQSQPRWGWLFTNATIKINYLLNAMINNISISTRCLQNHSIINEPRIKGNQKSAIPKSKITSRISSTTPPAPTTCATNFLYPYSYVLRKAKTQIVLCHHCLL
jgi:hypothetical protein